MGSEEYNRLLELQDAIYNFADNIKHASEIGEKIILNNKSNFNKNTDLLLYMAARSENIDIIKKSLNKKINSLLGNLMIGLEYIFKRTGPMTNVNFLYAKAKIKEPIAPQPAASVGVAKPNKILLPNKTYITIFFFLRDFLLKNFSLKLV